MKYNKCMILALEKEDMQCIYLDGNICTERCTTTTINIYQSALLTCYCMASVRCS